MDLVLQSADLADAACDAFRVALLGPRLARHRCAARLYDVPGDPETRRIVRALAAYWRCDADFVPPGMRAAGLRALVMDMDSTAITIEGIDELARLAGQGEAVAAITEAAMRGEIADYAQSLRRRVALLAGADAALLGRVGVAARLTPGARELLAGARALGWRTLLVSGGFDALAGVVAAELGFDEVVANELVVEGDRITGEVRGPAANGGAILDGPGKARMLRELCERLSCPSDRAVAVGDGANDLAMMGLAGVSVAWRAKPKVREQARYALDFAPLDGVLELFADRW
jgi:phosphoserine phosphatase